jgi:uncharacterized protein YkwD
MTPYMARFTTTLVAVSIGALAVAGCGATTAATESSRLAASPRASVSEPIERTDGRLGDATAQRSGSPLRELSRGGRPDARRRGNAPRRDGVGAGAACPNPDLAASVESLPAMTDATLCLLNGERADHGLGPLAPNDKLAAAATAYAQDLVAGSYFSHTGRDGSGVLDRIERSGYLPRDAGWVLGENLAWGTGSLATPGSIMQAWMNSPGHRDNILNPDYREIGIGVVAGNPAAADGLGATYATEFGAIEGFEEPEAEPVAVADRSSRSERAAKSRRRARRLAKARHARRAHQSRRAGKGRGRAAGKRRGRVGHIKARIAI